MRASLDNNTGGYALVLGVCMLLFIARVLGQALVAFLGMSWLPPMAHWYAGLLPYPILLPVQLAIVVLMLKILLDFVRGSGYFVLPKPRAGEYLKWLSCLYFLSMALRYFITMWLHPERRWFEGTIPIWFHMVLAGFIYAYSHYHTRHRTTPRGQDNP